ncbi:peroxisomal and mitochondrial division factor 1 [Momordica charantia]|uniref:Peroxisomal and mitochondrial division factor 1 n=1 Tax=Momordica charantia TaxID=3673 RepID=A0A6J1D7M2_MOMCH|nr:peroxisomal and mitochondrial division factor 1 [Momordica charantia]XP_022149758.1 peroxisomal and mitochondrial division factor 1 [Momordica charantia]
MENENNVINGGALGDDQTPEDFFDVDQNDAKVAELNQKIEVLEREKFNLVEENKEFKEKIKKSSAEIEGLKSEDAALKERLKEMEKEIEGSKEGNNKVLESVAARALELETEVARLQHDLISAMNGADEANAEVAELRRTLGEKGEKVAALEKEVEALKKERVESEKKVRELERKVGILEVKEIEEKSKKVRVEEEMRDKVEEKEREITGFKKKINDLESVVTKNGLELEKWIKEKLNVEELLKQSEEKTKTMEMNVVQLQKEVEEAHKVISGLKEKAMNALNGTAEEHKGAFKGAEKELNLNWPIIAGSTGVVTAVAALAFVLYGRQR